MKNMNQSVALGLSLKAFAVLMIVVCLIYEVITPSAKFVDLWFSYLIGVVLYAIGILMAGFP